ncbi:MAG: chromosomal replication initiator protein DnaA [Bacteroidota bacterium]|nr:chromosomal replication initiator protein DnaA [Bacteroidota bacterium]MDE2835088.1 chromosomal replication initiator protein DnaA [Bacteroidota bacterium]MDE2956351.1 chromosomal replication initiator protein DnaA [Bacteroidota bacterium]
MNQSAAEAWTDCLEIIRDNVPAQTYLTWFETLKPISLVPDGDLVRLTLQAPSYFNYEWLDTHFSSLIVKTVARVLGPNGRLHYRIEVTRPDAPTAVAPATREPAPGTVDRAARKPATRSKADTGLHDSYTFDTFIEGDCNRLARNASVAISYRPGETPYNPLFLYGGVGLGKTHLLHAVGNEVFRKWGKRVCYASSEQFTNDFVRAIRENTANRFAERYSRVDLLIIDDVQFFGGKEKTQEEFFHIFNRLHTQKKQLLLAADRPPQAIKGLKERLLSRFRWGLIADLQTPELETRMAILNQKASVYGVEVPPDVIDFVAQHVRSNIRELEGALIRLLAQSTFSNEDISLNMAREYLGDLITSSQVTLTTDHIQKIVCHYLNVDQRLLSGRTRRREIVQARHLAMYFCREFTQHTTSKIGEAFGGRDHSTVIHAIKSINNQIETNANFKSVVKNVRQQIGHLRAPAS